LDDEEVYLLNKPELIGFRLKEVKLNSTARRSISEDSDETLMELGSNLQLNKKDKCLVRLLFVSKLTLDTIDLLVISESRFKKTEEFTDADVESDETITLLTNMILSKHLEIAKMLIENSGYKISGFPETIEEFNAQPPSDVESQAKREG